MKIIDEYLFYLSELSYIISDKNKYYNYDKWKNEEYNKLFIVGLSGSGKSTLGKKLSEKFNCKYISLDKVYLQFRKEGIEENLIQDKMNLFFKLVEKKKEKMIIEGVNILYYPDPNYFKNKALIIIETSVLLSTLRYYFRDFKNKNKLIWPLEVAATQLSFLKKLRKFEKFMDEDR